MKLAFSTNAFSRHDLDTALTAIAHAGYTGVEILADQPHWYPDHFDPAVAAQVRTKLDQLHLQISNINANCTFGFFHDAPPEPFFEPSLISPKPEFRQARLAMIGHTLDFAAAVGADNISITTGKALPTMPPPACQQMLEENLKRVLDHAHRVNVNVGIECEPGLFVEYATELHALIQRLGSPLLGANLDLGHSIVIGEDIPATLQLLRGRIWNCHIEDLLGRKHYHLIPGLGTVDWPALLTALQAIAYDRFCTVELYTYPDAPVHAAQASIAHLRRVWG